MFLPDDPRGAAERHRRHAEELASGPGDRDGPASGAAHYLLHQGEVPRSQVLDQRDMRSDGVFLHLFIP